MNLQYQSHGHSPQICGDLGVALRRSLAEGAGRDRYRDTCRGYMKDLRMLTGWYLVTVSSLSWLLRCGEALDSRALGV